MEIEAVTELNSTPRNKRPYSTTESESDKNRTTNKMAGSKTSKKKAGSSITMDRQKEDASQQSEPAQTKYGAYTQAPYIVHFRVTVVDKTKKPIPMLTVAKKLTSANVKFLSVTKYSRNTWIVTFPSKAAANASLSNKYITEAGFSAYIPGYKLSRKIVIRGIPNDMSMEEIKLAVEDENQSILVDKIFRLRRKEVATNEWVETETVCLHIRGEVLPELLKILKTINPVNPYVAAVRMCYKCGLFGHISKFCEREEKCLSCGGPKHADSNTPCSAVKNCINCKGTHGTNDRTCPLYKRHASIAKVMAFDNLPYFQAKEVVIKEERKGAALTNTPPPKTLRDFPMLPSKKEISLVDSPVDRNRTRDTRIQTTPTLYSKVSNGNKELEVRVLSLIDMVMASKNPEDIYERMYRLLKLSEERNLS